MTKDELWNEFYKNKERINTINLALKDENITLTRYYQLEKERKDLIHKCRIILIVLN